MHRNSEINEIISASKINGIIVDYKDSEDNSVKFKTEMFEEFKQFCKQENYAYKLLFISTGYVSCNVEYPAIMHFVKCMQSENEETIKMLCLLPKKILINRANGRFCGVDWVYRTDVNLVREAINRYDESVYVEERCKMAEYL